MTFRTNEVKLHEVADVNPRAVSELSDNYVVSFLPMAAVNAGEMTANDVETRQFGDVKKGYTPFQDGDVLVAKITPCFENGKIAQAKLSRPYGFGSTEFHVLRPHSERLDARFLTHYLKKPHIRQQGARRMTGSAGQRRVPENFLTDLIIPLPPLPEQRRIAAILDKADELRAARRRALAQLDTLTQSIFLEMFGDTETTSWARLDELCVLITDGTHYTPTYSEEGVIFLSSRNVTSGYITWDDVKYIPHELHRELHKRIAPQLGDVLLAKNGTTGIAAVVDRDCVFDIYVSLALLRPSANILPIYLREAVNAPSSTRQFHASLKGIGVPNLHLKEIRSARIPIPPLNRQAEFASRVSEVERLRSTNIHALDEGESLFQALQHRAFRGEL